MFHEIPEPPGEKSNEPSRGFSTLRGFAAPPDLYLWGPPIISFIIANRPSNFRGCDQRSMEEGKRDSQKRNRGVTHVLTTLLIDNNHRRVYRGTRGGMKFIILHSADIDTLRMVITNSGISGIR